MQDRLPPERKPYRRAGLIFLLSTPIIAFCLSYPDVGFSVLDKTGNGVFYWPFLWVAIGLSLLFFVPLAISLYALPNKKRAWYLFLISVVVVSPVFIRSQWSASLIPRLAGWSAPTVLFGLFWLSTEALGWLGLWFGVTAEVTDQARSLRVVAGLRFW